MRRESAPALFGLALVCARAQFFKIEGLSQSLQFSKSPFSRLGIMHAYFLEGSFPYFPRGSYLGCILNMAHDLYSKFFILFSFLYSSFFHQNSDVPSMLLISRQKKLLGIAYL